MNIARNLWAALSALLLEILQLLLGAYQILVSPLLGPSCRFHPSCSRYAQGCLERHGVWRGSWLSVRRVCRCHPWSDGGYDPPPELLSLGTRKAEG
jgi:uncharacterized protein